MTLSADDVRGLYAEFRAEPANDWQRRLAEGIKAYGCASLARLSDPRGLHDLWSDSRAGTIDRGEHVDVSQALSDPRMSELVQRTAALGRTDDGGSSRAMSFQDLYDEVIALFAGTKPWAKASRVFALLAPRDAHVALVDWQNDQVADQLVEGHRAMGSMAKRVRALRRVHEVLGACPAEQWAEVAARSRFCEWLRGRQVP